MLRFSLESTEVESLGVDSTTGTRGKSTAGVEGGEFTAGKGDESTNGVKYAWFCIDRL